MNTSTFRNLVIFSNTSDKVELKAAIESEAPFRFYTPNGLDVAVQYDDEGMPHALYTEDNEQNLSADEIGDLILFFADIINEHDLELFHGEDLTAVV